MCGIISHHHLSKQISMLNRNLLFSLSSQLFILHIFSIYSKTKLNIFQFLFQFLFFLDDGIFVSQKKSYTKYNMNLYYNYSIISSLFNQFSLAIEHNKSEIFHFSRSTKNTNPPLLDLKSIGSTVLKPKDTWWYLEFFFDKKLFF